MSKMTELGYVRWMRLPAQTREQILQNVWCGNCGETRIVDYEVKTVEGWLCHLVGKCGQCGRPVSRVIENRE
ncbi:MAG: hypothetical protein ACOYD6_01610 [Limnochordia bacterium]